VRPPPTTLGELSEWYMFIPTKGPDKSLAGLAHGVDVRLMHKGHIDPDLPARRA
jgi:hypothetical protein